MKYLNLFDDFNRKGGKDDRNSTIPESPVNAHLPF